MPDLPDLQLVSDDSAIWHRFDPSIKAELFSTVIATEKGFCLIDPIDLDPVALIQLQTKLPVYGIAVTNQNHWRASASLAERLSVPIFAHPESAASDSPKSFVSLADKERIGSTLEVIVVEGAAPGEIALFGHLGKGTMIVGDALINFDPYGFTFLPPKYCRDHRKMRISLGQLMNRSFERMFFAHGLPIMSQAGSRLRSLLNSHESGG